MYLVKYRVEDQYVNKIIPELGDNFLIEGTVDNSNGVKSGSIYCLACI